MLYNSLHVYIYLNSYAYSCAVLLVVFCQLVMNEYVMSCHEIRFGFTTETELK